MKQTLAGWLGNALHQLSLAWEDPLTWVLVVAGLVLLFVRWRKGDLTRLRTAVGHVAITAWLVATLAITIYPLDVSFEPPPWERLEVESFVPLAGTIQSLGHLRDRTMSVEEHQALSAKIAGDLGIPMDEVNLGREIRGTDPASILRDPVANVLLFMPLGFLLVFSDRRRNWRQVAVVATGVSVGIEASQVVFGFGSLGSIDDVIFNTAGALIGYGCLRLLEALVVGRVSPRGELAMAGRRL